MEILGIITYRIIDYTPEVNQLVPVGRSGELGVSVHFLSATGCPAVLFLCRLDGLPMNAGKRAASPTRATQLIKGRIRCPTKYRPLLPACIKDYVSLNQFAA